MYIYICMYISIYVCIYIYIRIYIQGDRVTLLPPWRLNNIKQRTHIFGVNSGNFLFLELFSRTVALSFFLVLFLWVSLPFSLFRSVFLFLAFCLVLSESVYLSFFLSPSLSVSRAYRCASDYSWKQKRALKVSQNPVKMPGRVHNNTLQHTETHCNTLQPTATHDAWSV